MVRHNPADALRSRTGVVTALAPRPWPANTAEAALQVDLAKAAAFSLIGERKHGEALVGPHVWFGRRLMGNARLGLSAGLGP